MSIENNQNVITTVPDLKDLFDLEANNDACICLKRKEDATRASMIATGAFDADVERIRVTKGTSQIITFSYYTARPEHIDARGTLSYIQMRQRDLIMALVSEITGTN